MESNLSEKIDYCSLSDEIDNEFESLERGVYDYMPDSSSYALKSNNNVDASKNCNSSPIEMKTFFEGQTSQNKNFPPSATHKTIPFNTWLRISESDSNYQINGNVEKNFNQDPLNEIVIDNGSNCLNNNNDLYTSYEDKPSKSATDFVHSIYETNGSLEECHSKLHYKDGAEENQKNGLSSSNDDKIDYYNNNNSSKEPSMPLEVSCPNGYYMYEPCFKQAAINQTVSEVDKRRMRRDERKRRQAMPVKKAEEVDEYKGKLPVEDLIAFIDGSQDKIPDNKPSTLSTDTFKLKKVAQIKKKSADNYETSSDTIEHSNINDFRIEKVDENGHGKQLSTVEKSNSNSNKIELFNKSVIRLSNSSNICEPAIENEFITVQKKKRIKTNEVLINEQSKYSRIPFNYASIRNLQKSHNTETVKIIGETNTAKYEDSNSKVIKAFDANPKLIEVKLLNPASFPDFQTLRILSDTVKLSKPNEGCDLISVSKTVTISYADIASRRTGRDIMQRRRSLDLSVEIPQNDNSRSSVTFLQNVNNSNFLAKPSDSRNCDDDAKMLKQKQVLHVDTKEVINENMTTKSGADEVRVESVNSRTNKQEPVIFLDRSSQQTSDKVDILFGFETTDSLPRQDLVSFDEKCVCISNGVCTCTRQSSLSADIATSPINIDHNDFVSSVGLPLVGLPSVTTLCSNYPHPTSRPIAPLSTSSGFCSNWIRTPVVVVNPMLAEKATSPDLEDKYLVNKKIICDLKNADEIKKPLMEPVAEVKHAGCNIECQSITTQRPMFNLSSAQQFLLRGYEDVLKKMQKNPDDIRYYAD